ncbi:LOW QUALITY PROTEIN: stearoyl-CoA desaturase 5-like [Octopus sinensis]|uniref:LOW QUALITY PROTEIN: stearoyl-CoA desaturase 5-like n=1 Tax=Octopus sinensis TaxID=2607531 RepID=A0A7E6EI67_9MOLL|nr:LOW QUALITY PROTEIN: stearoyl-CoA desaturase 5-like [Octopus sinensis]
MFSALGITAGAHRLWSHRAYKAHVALRLFLMIGNSVAAQNSILEWSRDHRVHHKYSETDADPHNALRGFFFSHVGWLLVRKHPEVIAKGRLVNFEDLEKDPVVAFQHKLLGCRFRHYLVFYLLCCFILPSLIPFWLWNETIWNAFWMAAIFRYVFTLNCTWLVNSLAHMVGIRPYDGSIGPVENLCVILGAFGEGFHNFHHTFPHHYATSEFGVTFNPTTRFIEFMARIGLAYDLKTVPESVILKTMDKFGDGSKGLFPHLKGRLD